jgi:heme-degrading monooxygenase HmoA
MTFISITRLRVRSWRFLPFFLLQSIRAARQATKAPGNRSVSLLREPHYVFWTRTSWDSEHSMKAYILAGAHRQVMRMLLNWCDEAAVAHWTQDSAQEPAWAEAHAQVLKIGRLSKVNHPSKAQTEFQIPEPRVAPGAETRF